MQAEAAQVVRAHLDGEGAVPVSVGAASAVQVDADVFQGAREPVDAVVDQSIGDGAHRSRTARQVLVCQHCDPFRILNRHVTIVFGARRAFLGLKQASAGRDPVGRPRFSSH
jgi:hypothetical protein